MDGDVTEHMVSSRFTIRVGVLFCVRVYPEGEVASVYEGLAVVAPVGGAISLLLGSSSLWFHCFIVANLGAYATRPLFFINHVFYKQLGGFGKPARRLT